MIQLILARAVSSLCNCVTYFSGGSRSTGPNFNYRGFNKTRNDQTEYEIDSLLMEDDLVDELVATPLSAEEIAAKLSNSNAKGVSGNALGGREVGIDGNSLVRGADIWMGTTGATGTGIGMGSIGGTSIGIGARMERNENKISNDWWSDGDEDEDEDHRGHHNAGGSYGFATRGGAVNGNHSSEKIINATFFNGSPGPGGGVSMEQREGEGEDSYLNDLCFKGSNSNNNHHQLAKDSYWDRDFFDKDLEEERPFDFVPMAGNQENFAVHPDLNKREEEEEVIFGGQKDPVDYISSNTINGRTDQNYGFNSVSSTANEGLESKVTPLTNSQSNNLLEEDYFGNFASGSSPSNGTREVARQNETAIEDAHDDFFESKPETGMVTGGELPLRSGYSFDQETDDISLREGNDGLNARTMDYFSGFAGSNKEEPPVSIPQSSFDYIGFEEDAKGDPDHAANTSINNHHHVQSVRQEPGNAQGQGSSYFGGNLLEGFDDIFDSSLVYNDNRFGQDKTFQDQDDEFGMFDFVSAKPPPVAGHCGEAVGAPAVVVTHNQHQPSILLD